MPCVRALNSLQNAMMFNPACGREGFSASRRQTAAVFRSARPVEENKLLWLLAERAGMHVPVQALAPRVETASPAPR